MDAAEKTRALRTTNKILAFSSSALIGTLGGLVGLGGAEFRLPLLLGLFGFGALEAIILNKAMSLVVVATALPLRTMSVPLGSVLARWDIILTLLVGSLAGAWCGASWAVRISSRSLYRILAVLLFAIALVLFIGHVPEGAPSLLPQGAILALVGTVAGYGIGLVAALMGVAGGELLIPTIVLLFGVDLKLAGSLSLAVSLPTMIVAFARYSRDSSFQVLRTHWPFVLLMACGSLVGTFIGGRLLGLFSTEVLLPILAGILMISAVKTWGHATPR